MDRKGQENVAEPSSNDEAHRASAKRPYKAPQLRRLGSVRELTFGQTMGPFGDGGTGMMMMLM